MQWISVIWKEKHTWYISNRPVDQNIDHNWEGPKELIRADLLTVRKQICDNNLVMMQWKLPPSDCILGAGTGAAIWKVSW